jgi:hypothetical protein
MTETVQNHSVGEENEQPTPLLEPTTNHLSTNTTENQQPIDVFISSISRPISQPLLDVGTVTPMQQHNPTNLHASLTPSTSKRQSTRLAQKATVNSGKDAIQIAQDLLVKKLGELSGMDKQSSSDDFELYAQHFVRPIEKTKMEAIQALIEHGVKTKKKGNNLRSAAEAPGLVA